MKPINLTVSAFGSYAGKTVFEFNKLGDKGLYLITGDTGAGKTTIFDAISYALYGEPSGGVRDTSLFRSKYASAETPTFVELDFEYSGKRYFVKRSPDYERVSKRGNNFTIQKSEAELKLPDGTIITKIKDVNNKIKEILGIDRSQFTQIAMIAQGEFLKLILASTEERQKIFREIFATRHYQILQDRLKSEVAELNRTCDALRGSVKQYIEGATCKSDDILEIELNKSKSDLLPATDTMELINKIILQDTVEKDTISEELLKLESELSEITKLLSKEEETAKARKALEEAKVSLDEKVILQKQAAEKFEVEKVKLPEREELSASIVTAKNELPKYDELEFSNKSIAEKQLELSETKNSHDEKLKNISNLESKNKTHKNEFESLKNIKVHFSELTQNQKKSSEKKDTVENIDNHYKNVKSLISKVKSDINDLVQRETEKEEELAANKNILVINKNDFETLSNISVINTELMQKKEKLIDSQKLASELKTDLNEYFKLLASKKTLLSENKKKEFVLSQDIKTIEDNVEHQKASTEKLKDIEIINSTLMQKSQEITSNKNLISEIKSQIEDIGILKIKLENTQKELAVALEKSKNKSDSYESKFKAYMNDQAGVIAKTLVEGEKCPVCGSRSHPQPAAYSEDAPSKDELDIAKQEADEEKNNVSKVSEMAASIKVELGSKKDYLLKSATPIVGVCEFEAIEDLIDKESATLETTEKNLKKEIADCEEKIKEKENLFTEIKNNEILLKDKTTLLNQSQNSISSISAEIAVLEDGNKRSIQKRSNSLLGEFEFIKINEKLEDFIRDLNSREGKINIEIDEAKYKLQTFENLKKNIPLLEEKITALNNELNEIKRNYATKSVELKTLLDKTSDIKSSLITIMQSDKIEIDIGADANDFNVIEKALECLLNKLSECQKKLSEDLMETEKRVARHTELEKLIPKTDEEIKIANEKLAQDKITMVSLEEKITSLINNSEKIKVTLKYDSKLEAETAILTLEQKLASLVQAFSDAENKSQQISSAVKELEGKIKALEEQLKDVKSIDITVLNKKRIEINNNKSSIADSLTAIAARLDRNHNALNGIKQQSKTLVETETKYAWMKALSNTANGNLSGKEKIMLETYIQMTYFDRIITRANTRFMTMSNGQYELKRRVEAENNRSQSGLELNVIDHYNGSERSVKTLSGGEAFKASLSLALGLSDEIQASAGGIKLDTMFVDEGFGSLDEESLKYAINTLAGLAEGNRLIGIISHVAELKDKIDKQIIVKKAKSGGSFIEIIN